MTSYHPIYDVRLARSNLIEDNWKINPLIQFLNKYGFDCSTLGIEVHGTQNPNDQSFLKCEKEWASQGDCFIAILTERYNTLTKKIPPGRVHAEDGLSYAEGRPRFVFVEKGVTRDGSYKLLDNDHVIEFDPNNIEGIYFQAEKIVKLRKECQQNQLNNNIKNLGIIGVFTLTLYGGLSLLDALSNKNRKRITRKKAFKTN